MRTPGSSKSASHTGADRKEAYRMAPQLPPRGVIALFVVGVTAGGTVFFVHRGQKNERKAMRKAVYDDIERLEKLEQLEKAAKKSAK